MNRFEQLPLGAGAALMAAFSALQLALAASGPGAVALAVPAGALGGAIAVGTGALALGFAGIDRRGLWLPLAFVVGAAISCLVAALLCEFCGMRAGNAFLVWGAPVALALFLFRRRLVVPQIDLGDLVALAVLGTAVVLWCRMSTEALPHLLAIDHARIWTDYFIHGTELEQLGGAIAAGRGSILMVGFPLIFYHYGAFVPAAAIMQAADISGFAAATAIMLPFGLLLAVLGIYALGTTIANRPFGLLSAAVFACLPDPSFYGMRNGFFGAIWFTFTAPGTGYALGTCTALVTLFRLGGILASRRRLFLAALMLAALFEFRAHFFLVMVPLSVLAALWVWLETPRRRSWFVAGTAALVASLAVLMLLVPSLAKLWLSSTPVVRVIAWVNQDCGPTAYDGFFAAFQSQHGPLPASVLGLLLIVPCVLGVFLPLYPVAAGVVAWRRQFRSFDLLPIGALLIWLGIVLVAPATSWGDFTEYWHRSFPLVYVVALVVTVGLGVRVMPAAAAQVAVPIAAAACLVVGLLWTWPANPARPLMRWGSGFYDLAVQPGVVQAAQFLAKQARPGDVLAVTPMEPKVTLTDTTTEIVSLSGVPAVVGRIGIQVLTGTERRAETERRVAMLRKVEQAPDLATAFAALRAAGATWWVLVKPQPGIDPTRADFDADGVAVYRVPPE